MRWLFLVVLILNLAYIAWQLSVPADDAHYTRLKAGNQDNSIVLLSELKQQQLAISHDTEDKVASDGDSPAPGAAASSLDEGGEEAPVAQMDDGQAATATSAVQQPDEVSAGTGNAGNLDREVAIASGMSKQRSRQDACYTLGPFRDLGDLRELTAQIKPYVVNVDFRGREAKDKPLYWVYIQPQKDRQTAMATGDSLKANNIRDYFVIREGEKANGVSLGYFRNKNSAYSIESRVKKLGFDVVVDAIYKTTTVYWLDYQAGADNAALDTIVDKYIGASKSPRIKRLDRSCAI